MNKHSLRLDTRGMAQPSNPLTPKPTLHPQRAMAVSSSSLRMLSILRTPSWPPTAREKKTGLPKSTAVAPVARAVHRRIERKTASAYDGSRGNHQVMGGCDYANARGSSEKQEH